jgi:hypothetical protein
MVNLPIDNNKPSNVLRERQEFVATRHDKANHGLSSHAENQAHARANPITDKCSQQRARQIEEVNHDIPAKSPPQRSAGSEDVCQPDGGVGSKGKDGEIVDEPDERYNELLFVRVKANVDL